MNRRDFIARFASAAGMPGAAWAQQGGMRRVGILMPYAPSNTRYQLRIRTFREELRKRGWASGVNIQFDERWTTDSLELIRSAAANLVELKPDVILSVGGRVIPVLREMTSTIPIVIPGGANPVEAGWIESLARPGGNITGFAVMELSVIGKMLQTLKDIAPHVSRVGFVYNPDNPGAGFQEAAFMAGVGSVGVEPIVLHVREVGDIERAIANLAAQANSGVLFPLDITIQGVMEQTIAIVARNKLPAIYSDREFVERGGLAFYGSDRMELYRGAASYVDRILRGERPGDLPYQQPTKYDLVVNRKTATALGLTIPPRLLFTADEVIE